MGKIKANKEYYDWLKELKAKIQHTQIKAALAVNTELILFYWDLGKMISEKQSKWGSGLIEQLAKDLKNEFPEMNGFSRTNLYHCRNFYLFYNQSDIIVQQVVGQIGNSNHKTSKNDKSIIVQQVVGQLADNNNSKIISNEQATVQLFTKIPWGHHILILNRIDNRKEALFYIKETIENNWSRSVLEYQIETNLYKRQGKAISNFSQIMPKAEGDLASQLLKDPYNFDFLTLSAKKNFKNN